MKTWSSVDRIKGHAGGPGLYSRVSALSRRGGLVVEAGVHGDPGVGERACTLRLLPGREQEAIDELRAIGRRP